jgi:hypothetical protein
MRTASDVAPNGHARIATRSVAGGSFSLLHRHNYEDFAPTERSSLG